MIEIGQNLKELQVKASIIVTEAFKGKKDLVGKPYLYHLYEVANYFDSGTKEYIIGLLHDLLEDCPEWTEERLLSEGFPKEIVDAVVALTHKEGDSYEEYIHQLKKNELAIKVKISDLKHNTNIFRFWELTDKDIERLKKYHNAFKILTARK